MPTAQGLGTEGMGTPSCVSATTLGGPAISLGRVALSLRLAVL